VATWQIIIGTGLIAAIVYYSRAVLRALDAEEGLDYLRNEPADLGDAPRLPEPLTRDSLGVFAAGRLLSHPERPSLD
jgi:hypothetical protein